MLKVIYAKLSVANKPYVLSVAILIVIMLSFAILIVVMLSVVLLNVVAPKNYFILVRRNRRTKDETPNTQEINFRSGPVL